MDDDVFFEASEYPIPETQGSDNTSNSNVSIVALEDVIYHPNHCLRIRTY